MIRAEALALARSQWTESIAQLNVAITISMRNLNPNPDGTWVVALTEESSHALDAARSFEFLKRTAMDELIDAIRHR